MIDPRWRPYSGEKWNQYYFEPAKALQEEFHKGRLTDREFTLEERLLRIECARMELVDLFEELADRVDLLEARTR